MARILQWVAVGLASYHLDNQLGHGLILDCAGPCRRACRSRVPAMIDAEALRQLPTLAGRVSARTQRVAVAKPLPPTCEPIQHIAEHFTMGDHAADAVYQPSLHALMI